MRSLPRCLHTCSGMTSHTNRQTRLVNTEQSYILHRTNTPHHRSPRRSLQFRRSVAAITVPCIQYVQSLQQLCANLSHMQQYIKEIVAATITATVAETTHL